MRGKLNKMRIISGKYRGRKLTKSDHLKSLRPTTDKNREALFNILFSAKNFDIVGAKVLDLCCGTGAVAFEALSRGAELAILMDNNREHLALTKKNAEILGIKNEAEILFQDVKNLPQNKKTFDLIFIDPPYGQGYLEVLHDLHKKNYISEKTLVVIESDFVDDAVRELDFVKLVDVKKYGISYFLFLAPGKT